MDSFGNPFKTLFNICLLLLGSVLLLVFAVNVLRCIWPWLVGAGLVVVALWWLVWWHRQQSGW